MKASILLLLLGLAIFASMSTLQYLDSDWKHKIILFQSTRADVEKVLGKPIGPNYGVTYKLKDGVLYLDYYDFDHCKPRDGFEADWNVPEWTVTEIEYRPNDQPTLASLHLDLKKFRRTRESPEVPQLVSYINDEEGVNYTFGDDDKLNSVRYFAGSRHNTFRCHRR
jgi:hypothetical protein